MNTIEEQIDLLEELDNISKIHILQRDDIDDLMLQFCTRIVKTLRIERMSAWLLDKNNTALISVGEYDTRSKIMRRETILKKEDYPLYFEGLIQNKIIIAPNIYTHELTREFTKVYSIPNEIISLLDVPLRINGKLIGVMCFEKTGTKEKAFTPAEQSFAFSCATVFSSTMEARKRRAVQTKLDEVLAEKNLLIREMNHRINNNFGILISLIRLKKDEPIGEELSTFLNEYEQRIQSIKKIHDLLVQSNSYTSVNISDYIFQLVTEFQHSYPEIGNQLTLSIQHSNVEVPSKIVLNLGLITSEILINALKYSLHKSKLNTLELKFIVSKENVMSLTIEDSGGQFDFEAPELNKKLGLSLIRELAGSINMQASFPNKTSGIYNFLLKL